MFEIQISPDAILKMPLITMGMAGVSIALFAKYLVTAARHEYAFKGWGEQVCMQLVTMLVGLQILLWQLCYYSAAHDTMAIWCVGIAVACGIIFWRVMHVPLKSLLPTSRTIQVMLGVVSLLQVAGFVHTTKRFTDPVDDLLFASPPPGELIPNDQFIAKTDRGSKVSLLTRDVSDERFRLHIIASRAALAKLAEQSIEYAEPKAFTNCHGWVFTEGKHLLRSEDVQLILDENGYREVSNPQTNDVVVYRDQAGSVIHTGLVRSAIKAGTVLVESKWGFASTYLHFAENQPYSQNISYYRSPRDGHMIHMEASRPTLVNVSLPSDQ